MPVTLIQPQNADGKPTPMCAFDPKNGYIGHAFANMTIPGAEQSVDDVTLRNPSLIVCTRCGVLWTQSNDAN